MEHLPIFNYSLTIFISGVVIYAIIQFAYTYIKMPRGETLVSLLLTCIAFFYILSDALANILALIVVRENAARFFVLCRELVPLLIFIAVPYSLNTVFRFKTRIKTINRVLILLGIAAALSITAAVAFHPDVVLKKGIPGPGSITYVPQIKDESPLMITRNILLLAYLIYTVIIVLKTSMQKRRGFPGKNLLIGLVIVSYFAFNYFYSILFVRQGGATVYDYFPYMGFGIIVLIIFMNFGIVERFVEYFRSLRKTTMDLRSELYYDSGLGIRNRNGFRRDLKGVLDKSNASGESFSLIFFDIDDFRNINESYGEIIGDQILAQLARRLVENFTQDGMLYRIGGDEFSFILYDIKKASEAGSFASKVISSLKNPFQISGVPYSLSISVAILLIPRDGDDMDTIMNNAYSTIRSVKKIKNTYEFFNKDLLDGATNTIHAINLLRNSISSDEFILLYQPVVDVNGTFIYAEALLRCTNTDTSIGGPVSFIPLIEKAGMMKDLDNLVVSKAFFDMDRKINNRFRISINLSARQVVDPTYSDFLSEFAKQHGIERSNLILEITESSLVENMYMARKSLNDLKKNGFFIAIDDFGKGFSSLSYLAELPVDIIKIDMSFVHAVPGNARKETLAKYIIDLGHSLNLKVVAEGFEAFEQFEFYKQLGCDLFQGFYFSQPLQLQDLLKKYSFT